jgi:hypothetical protein
VHLNMTLASPAALAGFSDLTLSEQQLGGLRHCQEQEAGHLT